MKNKCLSVNMGFEVQTEEVYGLLRNLGEM